MEPFILESHHQYAEWKPLILDEIAEQSDRALMIATGAERHPDEVTLQSYQKAYESNGPAILAHRQKALLKAMESASKTPTAEGADKSERGDKEQSGTGSNIELLARGPFVTIGNVRALWSNGRNKTQDGIVTKFEKADDIAKRVIISALSKDVIKHVDAHSQPTSYRLMQLLDAALIVRVDNASLRWLTTRLHTMRMNNLNAVETYISMFNDVIKELDELDHLPETATQVNAFLLGLPIEWEAWRRATFIEVDRHFDEGKTDLTLLSSLETRACTHQLERRINALTEGVGAKVNLSALIGSILQRTSAQV